MIQLLCDICKKDADFTTVKMSEPESLNAGYVSVNVNAIYGGGMFTNAAHLCKEHTIAAAEKLLAELRKA